MNYGDGGIDGDIFTVQKKNTRPLAGRGAGNGTRNVDACSKTNRLTDVAVTKTTVPLE